MMLGAFVMIGLTNTDYLGISFWLAVPLALITMGIIGYLLEVLIIRRLFGQSAISVIILTIAIGIVIRFIVGLIWGHEPHSLQSPMVGRELRVGSVVLGMDEVMVIVVTVLLTIALYYFFVRTKTGVAMQAASQNQLAAYYMGIPVKRIHAMVWLLSGIVAAIAGILFAAKGAVDPSSGLMGIKAFAAAVIGGFGSLPGALLGGLIIGLIEPFAARYIPAGYSQLVPYTILILVLIFRPDGILSQVKQKKV